MSRSRPVTRVFLVHGSEAAPAALTARLQEELLARGVSVARHERGAPKEGSASADVALWLPDAQGRVRAPAPGEAPARLHAALVTDADLDHGVTGRVDALLVPHERLVEPVRTAARRIVSEPPEVVPVRLPLGGPADRAAARRRRRLPDAPVVLLDLRGDLDTERVIFQLALRRERGTIVLVADDDDDGRARARLRELCERQGVEAWLTAGADGLVGSLDVADLLIGRPRWAEIGLAAAAGAAIDWFGETSGAFGGALRGLKLTGEVTGVLHLSAGVDQRLADRGSIAARGTALREHLVGDARAFLDVLGSLRPREDAASASAAAWERVGPTAGEAAGQGTKPKVDAREPDGAGDKASRIEAELDALKARMHDEDGA